VLAYAGRAHATAVGEAVDLGRASAAAATDDALAPGAAAVIATGQPFAPVAHVLRRRGFRPGAVGLLVTSAPSPGPARAVGGGDGVIVLAGSPGAARTVLQRTEPQDDPRRDVLGSADGQLRGAVTRSAGCLKGVVVGEELARRTGDIAL